MLVDSSREQVYDELTKAAAQLLDVPFAFMTAVDDTRSFWKSTFGITDGTRFNEVGDSFCQYVINADDDLMVGDATANDITRDNPSIESMGVMAWAGCPVRLDGEVLGTFCVVDQRTRDWTDDERDVLQSLARIASREVAMNVRLRSAIEARDEAESEADRVRDLLDTIRVSLVPPALPKIDWLDLAAWYEPASGGDELLGDFYDAFPLAEGVWGLVIGDVCGHGVEAAKLTSLVRYSMRSAAVHHTDPAEVLAEVDRAIYRDDLDAGRFATACYFRLDRTVGDGTVGDGVEVRFCRAGHALPIVVGASGAAYLEGKGGPPLGVMRTPGKYVTESFRLDTGDTLVTYTDGVTESRDVVTDEMLGEERLLDVVTEAAAGTADLDAFLDAVRSTICAPTSVRDDDTVLLAARPRTN